MASPTMKSGKSAMPRPAMTDGSSASPLLTRSWPAGPHAGLLAGRVGVVPDAGRREIGVAEAFVLRRDASDASACHGASDRKAPPRCSAASRTAAARSATNPAAARCAGRHQNLRRSGPPLRRSDEDRSRLPGRLRETPAATAPRLSRRTSSAPRAAPARAAPSIATAPRSRRLRHRASRRAARSASFCPASVSASRREVRLNSRAPSRCSSRLTALDTVALDSASSVAAAANDRNSTTFAKIASASKSGSFDIADRSKAHFWKQ